MERQRPLLFSQPLATFERDGLKAALVRAGLPFDDVMAEDRLFWRFERDDMPVGFAGIEVHGTDALLRSLLTLPPLRQQGIGGAMIETMEVEARTRGARTIYLVTEECVPFFARRGYAACARDQVPAAIVATALVARHSPPAASLMAKEI